MIRRTTITMRTFAALALVALVSFSAGTTRAQFSQAVVIVKGTVTAEDNNRPMGAKVSVRAINDTAQEVTSSRSNAETGKYLVVLKPGKKYWVHLEGDTIMTKDIMIETPEADHTQQIVQDLVVTAREAEPKSVQATN